MSVLVLSSPQTIASNASAVCSASTSMLSTSAATSAAAASVLPSGAVSIGAGGASPGAAPLQVPGIVASAGRPTSSVGQASGGAGHVILLPPNHFQITAHSSPHLFHSNLTNASQSSSLSGVDCDSLASDDNLVDSDDLNLESSLLSKSLCYYNATSSLLSSCSSSSSTSCSSQEIEVSALFLLSFSVLTTLFVSNFNCQLY